MARPELRAMGVVGELRLNHARRWKLRDVPHTVPASPMLVNELIWTAIVPLVVAAAVMSIAAWFGVRPRAAWALSVGLGYAVASAATSSRTVGLSAAVVKHAQPLEAHDWLPLAVLLAMCVTLLASAAPRAWQRWIVGLAGVMCVAVPLRLVSGNVLAQWSAAHKLAVLAALSLALALIWLQLSTARSSEQPRLRAVLLVIVSAAMAAVLTKSGSLVFGRLCGVVAAALAGALIASAGVGSLFRQPTYLASEGPQSKKSPDPFAVDLSSGLPGAAGVLTMSLGGLVIVGHFYASLTATNAALLAASLIAAGGRLPALLTTGPVWRQIVIRAALCFAPIALVAARAF